MIKIAFYFIFLFSFQSHSLNYYDYDEDYSLYQNNTKKLQSTCENFHSYYPNKRNPSDLDEYMFSFCLAVLGNVAEGIANLGRLAENGNIHAPAGLILIYASRNQSVHDIIDTKDYEIWELKKLIYWLTKHFENGIYRQKEMRKNYVFKDLEKEYFNIYLIPFGIFVYHKGIYNIHLRDPSTTLSLDNENTLKAASDFLDNTCLSAKKFPEWSEDKFEKLLHFCKAISNKFFKPFVPVERKRVQAGLDCKSRGIVGSNPSHKELYDNCPEYKEVIDDIKSGVAQVVKTDPELKIIYQFMRDLDDERIAKSQAVPHMDSY